MSDQTLYIVQRPIKHNDLLINPGTKVEFAPADAMQLLADGAIKPEPAASAATPVLDLSGSGSGKYGKEPAWTETGDGRGYPGAVVKIDPAKGVAK